MLNKRMKSGIKIIFVILMIFVLTNVTEISAHDSDLGINGWDGISYDQCEIDDFFDESWYELEYLDGENNNITRDMGHLDDSIFNIYYKVLDANYYTNRLTWNYVNNGQNFKNGIVESMLKWNNVYVFKKDLNGFYNKIKLVNLVDYDSLDDTTGIDINVFISPCYAVEAHPYPYYRLQMPDLTSGYGFYATTSEAYGSTPTIPSNHSNNLGCSHEHYNQYVISVNIGTCQLEYTSNATKFNKILDKLGAHEFGHVLGLFDIDVSEYLKGYSNVNHHDEVLMGYDFSYIFQTNITYKDIAGVAITRGIHTNNDHMWLYDVDGLTQDNLNPNNHKLICSLCNCVKFVDDLTGYDYEIYGQCGHLTTPPSSSCPDEYMMPVACYGNKDYYKCKYCRYVAPYESIINEKYVFNGIFDEDYHILHNNVNNLEYDILEEHNFDINITPNLKKCTGCEMLNNGDYYYHIDLDCMRSDYKKVLSFDDNFNFLYEIDCECAKTYKFNASSLSETKMELYNENMVLITTFNTNILSSDYLYHNDNTRYMNPGKYFIKVSHQNNSIQDNINVTFGSLYIENNVINVDGTFNCNSIHSHKVDNTNKYHKVIKLNNNYGSGLFEIKLNATSLNSFSYDQGMIKIYSDLERNNLIDKYEIVNSNNIVIDSCEASNDSDNNRFIVSLPYKGYYYIEIISDDNNYSSLILEFNKINSEEIDLFDANENTGTDVYSKIISGLGDHFEEITLLQDAKINVSVVYGGIATDDIPFYILKKKNANNTIIDECIFISMFNCNLSDLNYSGSGTIELEKGTYYVGCYSNDSSGIIEVRLFRQITQSGSINLMIDPGTQFLCGSEINVLEQNLSISQKSYFSNVITAGFTRLLYLNHHILTNISRENYNWYSSDESIATVTHYGTVRGISPGTVKIMAIDMNNYSIAFIKEFIIVSDANVSSMIVNNNASFDYNRDTIDGTFRLPLELYKCPYPLYSLYTWSVVINSGGDNFSVLLDGYANITVNGLGDFTLYGLYYTSTLNIITVVINITIVEVET